MKKYIAILFVLALMTPVLAQNATQNEAAPTSDVSSDTWKLVSGWNHNSGIAARSASVYTTFVGRKDEIEDSALDRWTSHILFEAEFSFMKPGHAGMNVSVFGQWGGVYGNSLQGSEFTGFEDAILGAKVQLISAELLSLSVMLEAKLPVGKDEISIADDIIPIKIKCAGTGFLDLTLVKFGLTGLASIEAYFENGDIGMDGAGYSIHLVAEGFAVIGDLFVGRVGLAVDYSTVPMESGDNIDWSKCQIYVEGQLWLSGLSPFLRIQMPIDLESLEGGEQALEGLNSQFEAGDLTVSIGLCMFF